MKQTVKTALDGIRDAVQRLDEPIDPEAEPMELTPEMISNPRKIAPVDEDAYPTDAALKQEVLARMNEIAPVRSAPAADREAPLTEILQGMKAEPSPAPPAQSKLPPARAPADYGREHYLRQVFGLVGVALLNVAEPDYGVSTCREIADQLVMTYTIIRQLEGRIEEVVKKTAHPAHTVQSGYDVVAVRSDVVNLADQAALNLARQCLAAERQIRDRLQEIERKLER